MFQKIEQLCGSAQSYSAAGLGFLMQLDPMAVGAALLLTFRLIIDAPRVYNTIKNFFKKDK